MLQLAILGDLTTRISGDTSASDLIAANREEQAQLIANGDLGYQHAPPKITERDQPWRLPDGWVWCRLGEVTSYGYAAKAEPDDVNDQTWVLELEDIEKGTSRLIKRVFARDRKFRSTKNRFSDGAVLYGKLRPYLNKVLVADEDGVCTTEIAPIYFYGRIEPQYLRWYLKSPFFTAYAAASTHGMNLPRLGTEAARNAPFPFPPAREQKHIVAKVNELMALCDKLEAQQQEREAMCKLTRTVSLQALVDAEDSFTLHAAWSRVHVNMKVLLDGEQGVRALQDSLRTLAVHGLLSEWTKDSPSVGEIKAACVALKQKYLRKNWLRKQEPISPKSTENDVYPPHWAIVPFDEVAVIIGGVTKGRNLKGRDARLCAYLRVANVQRGFFDLAEIKHIEVPIDEIAKYRVERGDLLITEGGDWDKVGRTAIWAGEIAECLHQNHVFKARIPSPLLMDDWVELVFNSEVGRVYFAGASKQTTNLASINMTQLRSFRLPIPPVSEQIAILKKVGQLLSICKKLEQQGLDSRSVAQSLATAAVASITGIRVEDRKKMKAPKTELVTTLRLSMSPTNGDQAPLAAILIRNGGELPAKTLWTASGMKEIDAFYQQLKPRWPRVGLCSQRWPT